MLCVCFAVLFCVLAAPAMAQKVYFGKTFDKVTGKLVEQGDVFAIGNPHVTLAMKFTPRGGQLPIDTLFVVVKTLDGVSGRYIMKRNKGKTEGNAIIRVKAEGVYRVYVYNPARRARPVASANLFVTGPTAKTRAELIDRQRKVLIARGLIKETKTPADSTSTASAKPSGEDQEEEDDDLDSLDDEDDDLDDEEDIDDLDELLDDEDFFDEDDLMGEFEDLDDLEDDLDIDLEDIN
jgi:hypothetical protein